jgi:hypothetical protein
LVRNLIRCGLINKALLHLFLCRWSRRQQSDTRKISFWLTATGALLVNISLVVGEFARTGWLPYPPLSEITYSPGVGRVAHEAKWRLPNWGKSL